MVNYQVWKKDWSYVQPEAGTLSETMMVSLLIAVSKEN
jgi:hypothetical protein